MTKFTKVCEICGSTFHPKTKQKYEKQRTCSRKCGFELTSRTKRQAESLNCAHCGVEFYVPPSRIKEGAKYCSTACMGEGQRTVEDVECMHPDCTNTFYPVNRGLERSRKQYCSAECAADSPTTKEKHRKRMTGSGNHAWNGGRRKMNGRTYVRNTTHPLRTSKNYIAEHRLIIEQELLTHEPDHHFLIKVDGVKVLDPGVEVHHINQNRLDNALNNLVAMTSGAHRLVHSRHEYEPTQMEVWPMSRFLGEKL